MWAYHQRQKENKRGNTMKNFKLLLIAGLTAAMCLTGCGDKAEEAAVSSEIEEIVVEKEEIPVAEEVTEAPEA